MKCRNDLFKGLVLHESLVSDEPIYSSDLHLPYRSMNVTLITWNADLMARKLVFDIRQAYTMLFPTDDGFQFHTIDIRYAIQIYLELP